MKIKAKIEVIYEPDPDNYDYQGVLSLKDVAEWDTPFIMEILTDNKIGDNQIVKVVFEEYDPQDNIKQSPRVGSGGK